ncbi:KdsC family phosphatase [Aestuariirhabdus litorea]|uniref:3-deoxy-D-manno-octulosonate 8-phosphate phosphatase KdsC n=1 Tax=Aestuariirhabdus litorea TaxID=2528527 RepID=A0A3P3VSE8_9GAMM|nr:HAD family hydrolase [Aestuariirhabdus litorea]RRJ83723.1 HAD family hydrolase [Aestuariirhabdus litorea]RWW96946.1 HAD family hydrolase [Endozoicomonadaceae bacterium GTF-13]
MFSHLKERAQRIRLAVFDVDGVLTNGQLLFSENGEELKAFSTLDGQGIKMLQRAGIETAIITGRESQLVARRAQNLGIAHLYQGREDKLVALQELLPQLGLALEEVAYLGDDLPDLAAIRRVGLGAAVANAHDFVKQHACAVTLKPGGQGAAREFCDALLDAQGKLQEALDSYL